MKLLLSYVIYGFLGGIVGVSTIGYAIAGEVNQKVSPSNPALASMNVANWLGALVVVLGFFFVCVWVLRKLNIGNGLAAGTEKMRIVGGLALGVREKVMVIQVGSKQLVLAVTPGRIQTLTVLEGEDCLTTSPPAALTGSDALFKKKLRQALKGQLDD